MPKVVLYRLSAALAALALTIAPGCGLRRTPPPPSGSPNDAVYWKQRLLRKDYVETAIIQACPESSRECRSVAADLNHHFESDNKEVVIVDRIEVSRGQFIDFSGARIPGRVEDSLQRAWYLKW